jgi:hypothetical protein
MLLNFISLNVTARRKRTPCSKNIALYRGKKIMNLQLRLLDVVAWKKERLTGFFFILPTQRKRRLGK